MACSDFNCSCNSDNCKGCGERVWRYRLDDGLCRECILTKEVSRLERIIRGLRKAAEIWRLQAREGVESYTGS